MPVTNYDTVDGKMIGYHAGGIQKDFLTDALGSVTAEVDQTGNTKTFDGRYKPYGGDLSSTGTRGNYGWVGSWGYRGTGLNASSHYVRARHFSKASGSWTTADPLWPEEALYQYSSGRPTSIVDPSGLQVGPLGECIKCAAGLVKGVLNEADKWCKKYFGVGAQDGTVCNAFQHCYWNCVMAQQCQPTGFDPDECAKFVATSHEEDGLCAPYRTNPGINPPADKCMDLSNNKIGIGCASGDCVTCCTAHIKSGDCQIVKPINKPLPPRWKPCKTDCKHIPKPNSSLPRRPGQFMSNKCPQQCPLSLPLP